MIVLENDRQLTRTTRQIAAMLPLKENERVLVKRVTEQLDIFYVFIDHYVRDDASKMVNFRIDMSALKDPEYLRKVALQKYAELTELNAPQGAA